MRHGPRTCTGFAARRGPVTYQDTAVGRATSFRLCGTLSVLNVIPTLGVPYIAAAYAFRSALSVKTHNWPEEALPSTHAMPSDGILSSCLELRHG